MAVIISKQDTDIKTANNFYRVEAHNLSPYSSSVLTLNTAKTINVTFANAGNCQGVVLTLLQPYSSGVTTGITVKLKESGTERASVTLTADDITNNSGSYFGYWVTPFEFPTPYAIDTTPGKWTFEVSQTAMLSPWWYLQTSNGSSAMFATWCDNLTSFSANDTVICKDIVTISDDTQVRGTLSTGDSSNAIALLVCKSKGTPPTKTNNQVNLQIQPSSAPTTLTIDGLICWGAHGGWQVGTSTTPVPANKQATIDITYRTVGTNWGFRSAGPYNSPRGTILMYGEYPATYKYEMTADVPIGQTYFDTTDTTGINIGDEFYLSWVDSYSNQKIEKHTVTSTTATRVNFTPGTTSLKRIAGGYAYKLNELGAKFKISGSASAGGFQYSVGTPSNFYMQGVDYFGDCSANTVSLYSSGGALGIASEPNAYQSKFEVTHCVRYPYNNAAQNGTFFNGYRPELGVKISYCVAIGSACMVSAQQFDTWTDNPVEEDNNYSGMAWSAARVYPQNGVLTLKITNCTFENMALGYLYGKNGVFKNNYIKGGSSGGWQLYLANYVNCEDWSNNTWNSCPTGIQLLQTISNTTIRNDKGLSDYGAIGSTSFFVPKSACNLINFVVDNPDFNITLNTTEQPYMIEGSQLAITNEGGTTNKDRSIFRNGTIYRTGTGLSDTTVRTAGGYALKFDSRNGSDLMTWKQTIPTGDIQNKTMFVSVWVKISNSAYWAGTHTNPTLTINYDNGTTTSTVATNTTDWQLLSCVFTPATNYGQIEMKLTGASDATSPNNVFYVDDVNVSYPAGVAVDLGGLDLWANGLPVAPAIATVPSLAGVWDEPLSAHTIAGSAGVVVGEILSNTDATQAKVDTL